MLKKILIGFGLLFATLVAAGATFWFGWLTPPESAAVCENVGRVMEADSEARILEKKIPKKFLDAALAKAKKSNHDWCERFSTKKPRRASWSVQPESSRLPADSVHFGFEER